MRIVEVDLVNAVIDLCAVQLAEDLLPKFVIGYEIARLMLANEFVKLGIDCHIIVSQLLSQSSACHATRCVSLQSASQILLEGIHAGGRRSRQLIAFCAVEILIVGIDRGQVTRILFEVSHIVKCLLRAFISFGDLLKRPWNNCTCRPSLCGHNL